MIYYVEDDDSIRELVAYTLTQMGMPTQGFPSAAEFWPTMKTQLPELILLDVMLPGEDGLHILRTLREENRTAEIPVVMITARGTEFDKVQGLDLGADDYITKPFGTSELLARIRAAIRHTRTTSANTGIAQTGKFVTGPLTVDFDQHVVFLNGEDAHLTLNEYRIVSLLARHAGKVLTYDFIIKELWGPNAKCSNQILRVNMANIRRKIEKNPAEPEYIFTKVGVGYRMVEGD